MKCSDFRKGEFIMKKIITLILVGCMALSIGGCATEQDEPKSSSFIDSNNMDETNKNRNNCAAHRPFFAGERMRAVHGRESGGERRAERSAHRFVGLHKTERVCNEPVRRLD